MAKKHRLSSPSHQTKARRSGASHTYWPWQAVLGNKRGKIKKK